MSRLNFPAQNYSAQQKQSVKENLSNYPSSDGISGFKYTRIVLLFVTYDLYSLNVRIHSNKSEHRYPDGDKSEYPSNPTLGLKWPGGAAVDGYNMHILGL